MDARPAAGGDDLPRFGAAGPAGALRLAGKLALGALALAACARPGPAPAVHARAVVPDTKAGSGEPSPRSATAAPFPQTPEIRYELTHDPAAACWRVRILATGIDRTGGELRLALENWGEWTDVDSYYLRELHVRPPARPDPESPGAFAVEPPPDWDGTLEANYIIPLARHGSRAERAHGLLPKHDGTHAAGFSINTFVDLVRAGKPLDASRAVRFSAPPGTTIATGWGGISTGPQEVRFSHPIDNAPILFGTPGGLSIADAEGCRYEAIQFGAGPDSTAEVLRVARALVPLVGRNAGRPHGESIRVFLTPLASGGTNSDYGCLVGRVPEEAGASLPPAFVRLLAHELFHNWLGGLLDPPDDESLVWFHEGFTEYFAVWHVAASGLLGPDWFAERVVGWDASARDSEAFGKIAFADPNVRWRDANGPNETMGYQGGATLAFLADVELRRQGRPGLMRLVADLLRDGGRPLALPAIREWMEANGLREFYASHIAKAAALPEVGPALREIGFEAVEREASLTYLGIQLEGDGFPGRIAALDPHGPAAPAGFKVGDRVFGYSPTRMDPPRIADRVATPYRFALNRIASGAKVANIDVLREGKEVTLTVEPRLIPGGFRVGYRAGGEAVGRFFQPGN